MRKRRRGSIKKWQSVRVCRDGEGERRGQGRGRSGGGRGREGPDRPVNRGWSVASTGDSMCGFRRKSHILHNRHDVIDGLWGEKTLNE